MTLGPEQKVLQQAADQRMLIARNQVKAAGMSARQIRYRVDAGRWKEVRPHVFSVDGREPGSWEAVVLSCRPGHPKRGGIAPNGAVAARRHQGRQAGADRGQRAHGMHRSARRRRSSAATAPAGHGPDGGRGDPATTAERTLIDLCGDLELHLRLAILEDASSSGAARRRRFLNRGRACSMGRAGVRVLCDVADDDGAARFRSWLEAEAARIWSAAGLPEPRWNVVLHDRKGRVGEIDAVFPGGIVTVELDGMKFHSSPSQRRKDKERDRRLALSGRITLRYEWYDVMSRPSVMVAEIQEALRVTQAR